MSDPDPSRISGLYAVTDPLLTPGDRMLEAAEAALSGGARLLQYRDKGADQATRLHRAARLALICRDHGATFIVNDDAALAAQVEADGVHLGQSDGALATARGLLGTGKLIGVSCHGRLDLAEKAAQAGADYLALGRFFPSHTKPEAPSVDLDTLIEARRRFDLPLVAIGGVTADNGATLIEAGADALAVVHALFGATDIAAAARRLSALFDT